MAKSFSWFPWALVLGCACTPAAAAELTIQYPDGRTQTVPLSSSSKHLKRMTLHYHGGRSQSFALEGATAVQLNLNDPGQGQGGRHGPPGHAGRDNRIQVTAGSYGLNCKAAPGNKTEHLARQCDGKQRCSYRINHQVLGDPAVGCSKEYEAEWSCGSGPVKRAHVRAEAGFGSVVTLSCP